MPISFIGVSYQPRASSKLPWRTQINRCGRNFFIGSYGSAEEAARVYDNAAYYLKDWGSVRTGTRLNFPTEYEGSDIPGPLESTIKVRTWLRQHHPQMEQSAADRRDLRDSEKLELTAQRCIENAEQSLAQLRKHLSHALGRMKLMEARILGLESDAEKQKRVIEGLQNQGGQQIFKKVGGQVVPASQVDSHLG